MSWRIVVISNRAKLDLKLNYLVVRNEDVKKIYLNEIAVLLIESTAVSITVALLSELVKRKIKVIFCDEDRNPISELIPYYGSHDTSVKIKNQLSWAINTKDFVWTEIVTLKIKNQMSLLKKLEKKEYELLENYITQIEFRDVTNREGHAAKVYFNSLFGLGFTRSLDNEINAALNYGYTILLSSFNREIVANGYITQLGLFHDNMFNPFNLASDLMEPFRPIVDKCVYKMLDEKRLLKFSHDEKMEIVNILNLEVKIDGKNTYVNNAIKIYCKSIFEALTENDVSLIKEYKDEL